ncbi:MAG: ribosome recycling factor [Chloroflexota bacterium]
MIAGILSDVDSRMRKTLEALSSNLATIRTGRATPALIENIKIDYYDTATPLKQLAAISAPKGDLLIVQPWERGTLSAIEKAILKSDLGLNPANDGNVLRIAIPPLSEERRHELVKVMHNRAEEGRVALRNVRRDGVDKLRRLEKNKEISQDDSARAQQQLQNLTDSFTAQVDRLSKAKEKEITET